jgi:hypothetical protein
MTGAEAAGLRAVQTLALQRVAALSKGCETAQDEQLALLAFLVLQQIAPAAAAPSPITLRQLELLQEQWPHVIEESDWTVATRAEAGQPAFTVVGSSGAPQVLASAAAIYAGAKVTFYSGACQGVRSTILSVNYANGVATVTLNDNLPRPVDRGDRLTVTRAISSAAAQAIDITEVAGTPVSAGDWTYLFSPIDKAGSAPLAVTVGTAAVQLDAPVLANRRAILVSVPKANTAPIYLGFGASAGTVTSAGATMGIEVQPGGYWQGNLGPNIPVYAISTLASQNIPVAQWA